MPPGESDCPGEQFDMLSEHPQHVHLGEQSVGSRIPRCDAQQLPFLWRLVPFPLCWEQDLCEPLSLASALTLFVCKNPSVSHWATWIPCPFIIYIFCNLDFQFVYRIVLGSSKRAKEEICIAELKAEPRPSRRLSSGNSPGSSAHEHPGPSPSLPPPSLPFGAPSSPCATECAVGAGCPRP